MTVNDRWIHHHCVFQIKWYEEYLEKELKDEPEIIQNHMESWVKGKIEAYKDMLREIENTRENEAEKIKREMEENENNEQLQSA